MLGTALFIVVRSMKNRLRRRMARLTEPRYLLGALAGAAYLCLAFFARSWTDQIEQGSGRRVPEAFLPSVGGSGPSLAGLVLLVGGAVSWAMPFTSGLLAFTRPETDLLFPAPVSRRWLVLYRLLRSQGAVFFAALIVAVTYPVASASGRLRGLAATWLVLMACHVFFTGVTLVRARFRVQGVKVRIDAWLPLLIVLGAAAIVCGAVGQIVRERPIETASEVYRAFGEVALSGWTRVLLIPLVALVKPLFAESFGAFLTMMPAAFLIYLLCIAWVLHEDAALIRLADVPEGDYVSPAREKNAYRARPVEWTLATEGRAEAIFIWKSALQTFRIVDRQVLIRVVAILLWLTAAVGLMGRARGFAQALGLIAALGSGFIVFIGPQMLRLDLRQDLQHLELLKTWPLGSAAIVRGEIIWPAAVITCLAWMCAAIAMFLSAAAFSRTGLAWRMAVGSAACILAPAVVIAQYTVHNAMALMFPAWISIGKGRPRGLDAMGQRLIVLAGTWLLTVLMLAPGIVVGGVVWGGFYGLFGPWVLVPAALACLAIVATEVMLATETMGSAYERLDISSVERGE